MTGVAAQRLLRPKTFGDLGHFRAASLAEIAAQEPVHQGEETCNECHADIYELHEKDIHFGVQCEDCHGPGNLHVAFHTGQDPSLSVEQAAMPKEYTLEGCLFCHRKLLARPRSFPQVDPVEHYRFLRVQDPQTRCVECHSPHEPLFLLTRVNEARIHPAIFECAHCHQTEPERDHRSVEHHPVIFVCGDCHAGVVKDFASREHAFMRCTACHLYHGENETAGRIFNNGNRKFCLLCHEQKPFKDPQGLPQIDPEAHLTEMAAVLDLDAEELKNDPRACLTCHFDNIHDSALIESGKVLSHE